MSNFITFVLKKKILFLCTHNSARSQIAEALCRTMYPEFEVHSAGIVKTNVKPMAIKVMSDIGIDITGQYSKLVDEFVNIYFDIVITVCDSAKEQCPYFPNAKKLIHKSFSDPSDIQDVNLRYTAFTETRDQIKKWLVELFGPPQTKID